MMGFMTRILAACVALCCAITPARAHEPDLRADGRTVALSTTTWALLAERDALRIEALTLADAEIAALRAELAVRETMTASVAVAIAAAREADADLGACLAREAACEARLDAAPSAWMLGAGAGGAALAGALVGVLACGVAR
jgi:hypothetical protein